MIRKYPPLPEDIAALNTSRQRKLQIHKNRLGICGLCSNPVEYDCGTWCSKHNGDQRLRMAILRSKRRCLGLCLRCDLAAIPGTLLCPAHAEVNRRYQEKKRTGVTSP